MLDDFASGWTSRPARSFRWGKMCQGTLSRLVWKAFPDLLKYPEKFR